MKTKSRNLIVVFLMTLAMLFSVFAITPLTVFANETEAEITEVTTFGELLNAVNSDKTHIKLMNDIENIVPLYAQKGRKTENNSTKDAHHQTVPKPLPK